MPQSRGLRGGGEHRTPVVQEGKKAEVLAEIVHKKRRRKNMEDVINEVRTPCEKWSPGSKLRSSKILKEREG